MNRQEAEKIKQELMFAFYAGETYGAALIKKNINNFEEYFNKAYLPEPEYIPFEYTDFNQFMLKKVRRKGEHFKDEIWCVYGIQRDGVVITTNFVSPYVESTGKLFSTMFEEWEFADEKPFGKLKI